MQTFLPFEDFDESARVLDRQRLGKQRVECKQILRAIHLGGAWKNHPAVRMWRGHTQYLIRYYYAIVEEWKRRGYKHNMVLDSFVFTQARGEPDAPPWLGTYSFHERHRAMLVYKNYAYYAPLFEQMGAVARYQTVYHPSYWWPPANELLYPVTAIEIDALVPF